MSEEWTETETGEEEAIYRLTQWQLMWLRFKKHRLAMVSFYVLIALGLVTLFAQFVSPYDIHARSDRIYQPPSRIHVDRESYFRFFVYAIKKSQDPETFKRIYEEDETKKYYISFFVHSWEYSLWNLNLFKTDLHLFGIEEGGFINLMGTDKLGRDLFSCILHGAQVSLSIGLMGIFISFVLGLILGGISGYFGGVADMMIQRAIEFLRCIPTIPLWMALGAAFPLDWPPLRRYFGITVILAIVGWTGLARVVRGKLLELRNEDYVMAARLVGASGFRIITRHLLPGMTSYLIVNLTLSIPWMILGETSLSFLGLGLRPPVVSWGVLLQDAQQVSNLYLHSWVLFPALFVVVTVLAFNGMGDGLRDAADPYAS